ncbi:hypothetical protein Agub_g13910, partial [Astrephomene gubernaculifera]
GGAGGRGLTAFLVDVVRLSRAMGALAEARDANAPPTDPDTLSALSSGRSALLSMVRRRTPPRRLCLPLLFYCIPLLEATAAGGRLFSAADMQALLQWATECARATATMAITSGAAAAFGLYGSGVASGVGAAGGGGGGGLGALAAALGVPERYARDVQLTLVRGMARAHVLDHSSSSGG